MLSFAIHQQDFLIRQLVAHFYSHETEQAGLSHDHPVPMREALTDLEELRQRRRF
jgi:hypothetical protein